MKKSIFILSCFASMTIFMVGCNSTNSNENYIEYNNTENTTENEINVENVNLEKIAVEEAKNITTKYGYSLSSETSTETMIGDSEVFTLIKEASIKGGYTESDLNSMTENRKILEYELNEKSKKDKSITLGLVLDKKKVIGAYLDCADYNPSIKSIDFTDDFKK